MPRVLVKTLNTPADMTDAEATRLGLKQYLHGTTYNGGNAPTVAGTGATILRGAFLPYQTQDGTWRLKFNFGFTLSSATRTNYVATINGVAAKNITSYHQSVSVNSSGGTALNAYQGWILQNTGTLNVYHASFTTEGYTVSGDIELESKPTWAY